MIQSSPGDVRQATIADDLKRIRLTHRVTSLERVIAALRAEYEARASERLPATGLKRAIEEFTDELRDVAAELAATPEHHESEHRVLGGKRDRQLTGARS